MKKHLLLLVFTFIFIASFGQTHKITVFGKISNVGRVDYIGSAKYFPDSVKASVAIQYKKSNQISRDPDEILLLMTLDGWKLVTARTDVVNGYSSSVYIVTKEIELDYAAYNLYAGKLRKEDVRR